MSVCVTQLKDWTISWIVSLRAPVTGCFKEVMQPSVVIDSLLLVFPFSQVEVQPEATIVFSLPSSPMIERRSEGSIFS